MSDPNRPIRERKPLGPLRSAIATLGAVIMILIGSRAFFAASAHDFDNLGLVIAVAGVPFFVGVALFCAALWAGRNQF